MSSNSRPRPASPWVCRRSDVAGKGGSGGAGNGDNSFQAPAATVSAARPARVNAPPAAPARSRRSNGGLSRWQRTLFDQRRGGAGGTGARSIRGRGGSGRRGARPGCLIDRFGTSRPTAAPATATARFCLGRRRRGRQRTRGRATAAPATAGHFAVEHASVTATSLTFFATANGGAGGIRRQSRMGHLLDPVVDGGLSRRGRPRDRRLRPGGDGSSGISAMDWAARRAPRGRWHDHRWRRCRGLGERHARAA